ASIQKSLNILERYLLPLSQTSVTTRLDCFCSRHQRNAAASSVPVEEPPRIPSLRKSSRAVVSASASVTVIASEAKDRSQLGGTKSSPMPSTTQDPGFGMLPVLISGASTDPCGSARIIFVLGATRFRNRPMPVSVPPEPTPT